MYLNNKIVVEQNQNNKENTDEKETNITRNQKCTY